MEPNPSRAEADRLLGIAEKLLQAKDFNGSRDFAVLAQETDSLLDGPDQILAVVDVLIASQKRINNHPDYYALLQVDHRHRSDLDLVKKHYRRLAFLLHPDKNRFAFSDAAFRLVAEAWAVLSDSVKKLSFDNELNFYSKVDLVPTSTVMKNNVNQTTPSSSSAAAAATRRDHQDPMQQNKLPVRRSSPWAAAPAPERGSSSGGGGGGGGSNNTSDNSNNFWTACPYCYNLYEYPRVFVDCCLRCQNCDRAFHAASIAELPPIVPGKEAYHCCWGFFPMGFTVVNGVEDGGGGGKMKAAAAKAVPNWTPAPAAAPPPPPPPPAPVVPEVFVNATPAAGPKKRGRPKRNAV
ncbi:hypothetical protein RHSIM_Rhsim07G0211600 [Rhododendron simsii]|uniref:J domain-containing protein n=1 Tax=Rhododendron simsii TaxID=118357 RepID=A0A834GU22_RHOSS|nr:hypothetical protein RHSIM_Rhsim07G0211600 [Rhododendron simsii]